MKTNDVMTATMQDRISTIFIVMILSLLPAGTAWAMRWHSNPDYLDDGATWTYALPDSKYSVGAIAWTTYSNPKRHHCTRLKLDGAWRTSVYADAGSVAHDEGKVTKNPKSGMNAATAAIGGTCPTILTVSSPDRSQPFVTDVKTVKAE